MKLCRELNVMGWKKQQISLYLIFLSDIFELFHLWECFKYWIDQNMCSQMFNLYSISEAFMYQSKIDKNVSKIGM